MSNNSDKSLWSQLQFPFGYPEAIDNLGTIAAPLLAGFAFTLIGITIGNRNDLGKPDLALLLLVIASVALVSSVQFNFAARSYHFSPTEYFDLQKLASEDGVAESDVKSMATEYLGKQQSWANRTRIAYNFGVAVLFFGIAATLIPVAGICHMAPIRACAVLLMVAAGIIEATLIGRETIKNLWQQLKSVGSSFD